MLSPQRFALLACCGWLCHANSGPSAEMSSAARVESRSVFGYDPRADFISFDRDYAVKHARYVSELQRLQGELAEKAAKGRATPCSRQLFLEARWLTYYSALWDRIEERQSSLREMLARPADPPEAREQIAEDGSFDHCSHAWFLKLDSTIEEVEDRVESGKKIPYPLKLLDRINSPSIGNCGPPLWNRCLVRTCARRVSTTATN